MQCPSCAAENPAGAKFCMSCGSGLAVACASCGTELPGGAAFCFSCGAQVGAPVAPEPAAESDEGLRRYIPNELLSKLEYASSSGGMVGERRTVTMLFCDVQGSTAAAQTLDPEEWADIMNGAFEHLIAPVYRYEGTLARLMGDAILAFFGAPIGHEDDPERAVLAGLEILDEIAPYRDQIRRDWGIEFDVRVGINTGLVVVGAVGSDLRVEYTAMGDAVNLAARMEQTAQPGTVQITAETKKLVERLFEFETVEGLEVKGVDEPVTAYRVSRALPRPDTIRGIEGLTSPLVGRVDDLDALVDAVECVATTGRGRIVSLMAEAGLGKSRLVAEARGRVAGPEAPEWHEGRSLSYETQIPYASVRRIIRSLAGLTGGESAGESWRKVEELASRALPGRVAETAPFLAWMLFVEPPPELAHRVNYLEPPQLRIEAFRAVTEVIEALASKHPLVIGFEDLHWADDASIDLVLELLPIVDRAMLSLVLMFRPRRQEGAWRVHEAAQRNHPHAHTEIALQPLDVDETRELIANLLAVDGLTDSVRNLVLEKAEGNPFYVEEIVRSMIDQGAVAHDGERWIATDRAGGFAVPDTLSALLTTRLDALDEGARRVVQAAAVVGRQFRYDEVAAALDDVSDLDTSLAELQRRDLAREITRIPKRVYRFKHALTQEAAYDTVLLKQRTRLHGSIADFLITTQPERSADIADHLVRGKQVGRAVPYLVAAGEDAARSYALETAKTRLEMALDAMDDSVETDLLRRALEALGQVRQYLFDIPGAAEVYGRLRAEGEQRGDIGMQVSGMNKGGLIRGFFFDERLEGLDDLVAAEAIARESGDDEGLIEACMNQCRLRTGAGEFDEVEYYMGQVIEIGKELEEDEPTLFGLVHLANTLAYMTRYDESLEVALRALAVAEEARDLHWQAELLTFSIPTCHMRNGDFADAMSAVERGMEIALAIGDRSSEAFAAIFQGKVATAQGYLEEALTLFRRAQVAATATGIPYIQALGVCVTGTCLLAIGGPATEEAVDHHNRTLEMMELPTGTILGAWLWTEVGHCNLAIGKHDVARDLFQRALTEQTAPMFLMRPSALAGSIEVAIAQGRLDDARSIAAELDDFVTSRRMMDQAALVPYTAGLVAAASGDHEAALASFTEAEEMVAGAGMRRMALDLTAARIAALEALGRDDEAEEARQAANALRDDIAQGISDESLRSAFLAGSNDLFATT